MFSRIHSKNGGLAPMQPPRSSLDVKRRKRLTLQSSICCELNKCKLCKVLKKRRPGAPHKVQSDETIQKRTTTNGEEKFQVTPCITFSQIGLTYHDSDFTFQCKLFFVATTMGTSSVVSTIARFRSSAVVSTSATSSSRNDSDGCTSVSSSAGRVDVGRRGFLGGLIAVGVGGAHGGSAVGEEMAPPEVGLREGRLRGCDGRPPCVSTSAFQSPSRFMPPWTYLGTQKDAYIALKSALARMGAQVVSEDGGRYVYAVLQSSTTSKEDIDDLEFLFKGKVVCYRSVSRVFIPDPPFCWWAGCINGPRNRGRLEKLRDDLGWMPLETDEDKHWVPLLLH